MLSISPTHAATDWRDARSPHYREVFRHFLSQDYFAALVDFSVAEHFDRLGPPSEESELLRGGLYLSYGMPARADAVFHKLTAETTSTPSRDRALFYLAKLYHQRGDWTRAGEVLDRIRAALPGDLEEERQVLQAYVLMQLRQPARAVATLQRLRPESAWGAYGRYNLGVAFIKAGERDRGLALLDVMGKHSYMDEELKALRDKANVAAAFVLLQDGDPEAAKRLLERVRLDGLSSGRALLGMGWAYAAQHEYERALVYWNELAQRDAMNIEVQEAMLAVPYALRKLEARKQALREYENAVGKYEVQIAQVDASLANLRVALNKLLPIMRVPDPLARAVSNRSPLTAMERRHLSGLFVTFEFQRALDEYRDLVALRANVRDWLVRMEIIDTKLESRAKSRSRASTDPNGPRELQKLRQERDRLRATSFATMSSAREASKTARLLRELDQELVTAQHRAASVALASAAVDGSTALSARSRTSRARASELLTIIERVLKEQDRYIEQLARTEFDRRKRQLVSYRAQAQFAIAELHEQALPSSRPQ